MECALQFFGVDPRDVLYFEEVDPFNSFNTVSGYICKKDGSMVGSLAITKVNEFILASPFLVYGTPKLTYPYRDFESREFVTFPNTAASYLLSNKWDGTNVLAFKYPGVGGETYVSLKTKANPFLCNSYFGNFRDLAHSVLGNPDSLTMDGALPRELEVLRLPEVQSVALELCGAQAPHLVRYSFALRLVPLFLTTHAGTIRPIPQEGENAVALDEGVSIEAACREAQDHSHGINEAFRRDQRLPLKYEYSHFATEGHVLYLLDESGAVVTGRTMYKIKPADIEEVHWERFDETWEGRVRVAFRKVLERNKAVGETSMKEELDMGPKQWAKFGKRVMRFVAELQRGGGGRVPAGKVVPCANVVADVADDWTLPIELLSRVLTHLGVHGRVRARRVSRVWWAAASDPALWLSVDMRKPSGHMAGRCCSVSPKTLSAFLLSACCSQATSLRLPNSKGTDAVLLTSLPHLPCLTALDLSLAVMLTDRGLNTVVRCVGRQLRSLALPGLNCVDAMAMRGVANRCRSLTALDMGPHEGMPALPGLADVVFSVPLQCHALQAFKAPGILLDVALSQNFRQAAHLTALDLCGCLRSCADANVVLDALGQGAASRCLRTLSFGSGDVTCVNDDGMLLLSAMSGLTQVSLVFPEIVLKADLSVEGLQAIARLKLKSLAVRGARNLHAAFRALSFSKCSIRVK